MTGGPGHDLYWEAFVMRQEFPDCGKRTVKEYTKDFNFPGTEVWKILDTVYAGEGARRPGKINGSLHEGAHAFEIAKQGTVAARRFVGR
jgi:hypothetical protein